MVQRKVPSKLGIQADYVKFEKRLANLKTSSQFQDGKARGADLKKKMKKSRSTKLSDIESSRSSPLRKNTSQPGKPPPLKVPNIAAAAAAPQKQQPLTKTTDGSPNYMKPTSCSDARKEKSQVSLRNSPARFSDTKNQLRRNSGNSKHSSAANNKPVRTLTRNSSLKLMRTLTKTPSFKPARASAKKSSRVALYADMNVQRATCSSTLKGSKFPDYLVITPGGTEAEGTSVMKVCPYTYCSLNGHHHSPVTPLKCFLSARRRSLKTQKMMKFQALTPPKGKPSNDGIKEIDFQQMFDGNDTAAPNEAALDNMATTPLIQVGVDFFVEIYATIKEDDAEAIGRKAGADERMLDFVGDQDDYNEVVFPNGASDEAAAENYANDLAVENLSNRSPESEIYSEEILEEYTGIIPTEAEIKESFPEEEQKEDADGDYPPPLDQEEAVMGSCPNESDSESPSSIEVDYANSEGTDMEWEEGQFSTTVLDDDESGSDSGCSSIIQDADMHEEPVIKSDVIVSKCNDMIQGYYELLQELLEEKSASLETQLNDGVIEQDGTKHNFEIQDSGKVSERLNYDQLSYTENAFEGNSELSEADGIEISSSSIEEPSEELSATGEKTQQKNGASEAEDHEMDSHLGDVESNYTSTETDEASTKQPKNKFHDDGTSTWTGNQIYYASQDISEADDAETNEGCNGIPEKENSEADQNVATSDFGLEQELTTVAGNQLEETEQVDDAKLSAEIQLSDSADATSEADEDSVKVDGNESCKLKDSAEDGNSGQDIVNESILIETKDNLSDGNYKNNIIAENQSILEKDHGEIKKPKISSSIDFEDQSDLRLKQLDLAEKSTGEADKMDVENNSEPDGAETFLMANNSISPGQKRKFSYAESNSNQELLNTCNNRKGAIRCKRSFMDEEEQRKYNPRGPNYLPLVPDPEAEKVDLRHQMMDEKKNAEEWMLDFALQQAVTKLAPARKRKVALLVEAFEKVMPVPRPETHLRHPSAAFSHARPMQACS